MPRPKAPCGTYSAYKRHLRSGEDVDDACRRASDERVSEQREQRKIRAPKGAARMAASEGSEDWDSFDEERRQRSEVPPGERSRDERLRWQLLLIETAMAQVAEEEPSKLAPLSKRHSELLAEIDSLSEGEKEADPFDAFFDGDVASNVVGFPTPKDREAS